jgi:hypothetical protein
VSDLADGLTRIYAPASTRPAGERTTDAGADGAPRPGPPVPPDAGDDRPRLPADSRATVRVGDRQLPAMTADALAALRAADAERPEVFQRGDSLVRVRRDRTRDGAPSLDVLGEDALRGHLARSAQWVRCRTSKDGDVTMTDVPPPMDVVRDVLALPSWDDVPPLRALVECPTFDREGRLIDRPGYHPEAMLYYAPAPDLDVPTVPEAPTPTDVAEAHRWLLDELLCDFPFVGDPGGWPSRANALAALLLPFVREMIDGPTPLHLIDAPLRRTGKSLLASALAIPALGRPPDTLSEASDGDEMRKRCFALLLGGCPWVLLDNLHHRLDAGALAAVLTSTVFGDRVLGASRMGAALNRAVWMATGNNVTLSPEIRHRSLWVRLDANTDHPETGREFRHPFLLDWAKRNRGRLVWSALVLARSWIAAGKPPSKARLAGYESWASVMGGILDNARVKGLMGNAEQFRRSAVDEEAEWASFGAAWDERYGDQKVLVRDLLAVAEGGDLLAEVLDGPRDSRGVRLGRAVARRVDVPCGGWRIEHAGRDHRMTAQYRLRPTAPPPASPQ